jgi:SAM-dependent methyltransferase
MHLALLLLPILPLVYYFIKINKPKRAFLNSINTPKMQAFQEVINTLYAPPTFHHQIAHQAMNDCQHPDLSLIYGEVNTLSFAALLAKAAPKKDEIFYDLGAGAGKAVFTAALLYEFKKVVGIECLKPLYDCCLEYEKKLLVAPIFHRHYPHNPLNIKWVCADYCELDFYEADILLLQAAGLMKAPLNVLIHKIVQLKTGSRLILISKSVSHPSLKKIHQGYYLMSWGQTLVNVYQIIN